jgi:ribonuclease P protein component
MLARANRFHGYKSLNWAYAHGQSVRDQRVALKFALNPRRSNFRVAVVISRKVNKSAVVRNRIRRRIYEMLRAESPNITGGYDLIFSVYNDDLANMKPTDLNKLIKQLLERAKII